MTPQAAMQSQDPRSQYLARALASLGQQPQGTAAGLGDNLMADAIDQYALRQRQQQLQNQSQTTQQIGATQAGMAAMPQFGAGVGLPNG